MGQWEKERSSVEASVGVFWPKVPTLRPSQAPVSETGVRGPHYFPLDFHEKDSDKGGSTDCRVIGRTS